MLRKISRAFVVLVSVGIVGAVLRTVVRDQLGTSGYLMAGALAAIVVFMFLDVSTLLKDEKTNER